MPYKYRDIESRLLILGFLLVRQKGSHVIFAKDGHPFVVPKHGGKDISPGVEKKLLSFLGMDRETFHKIKQ